MSIDNLINKWSSLQPNVRENQLNAHFTNHLWDLLGFKYEVAPHLEGIQPDFVLYDHSHQPLLVVETKRRTSRLNNISDEDFIKACKSNALYKQAVGNENGNGNGNGIRQYLSVTNNPPKYGLVFNGDFFQLFRRYDGLIFPIAEVQKVTKETLPVLIEQLQHCLNSPPKAFIISMWNRKGGVGKTTNTVNIAAVLSALGKRVLLVDFDPQVDLTKSLGLEPEEFRYKLLKCFDRIQLGEKEQARDLIKELIQTQHFQVGSKQYSISLLPGEKQTLDVFGEQERNKDYPDGYEIPKQKTVLKRALSLIDSEYDYIIIDTSPKADMLTACSLFAADGVIIPSDYDPETLRHVQDIICNLIPKYRQHRQPQNNKFLSNNNAPLILGLVFSNCPQVGVIIDRRVDEKIKDLPIKVYQTRLRRYDRIPIAKWERKPVIFHQPKCQASQMYIKLTKEIFVHPNFVFY